MDETIILVRREKNMKKRFIFIISFILIVGFFTQALAQFTPEELAERGFELRLVEGLHEPGDVVR